MRIAHVCLACFYFENYGYQENILPKAHKCAGHDVVILAEAKEKNAGKITPISDDYINSDNIPVKILIPNIRKIKIFSNYINIVELLNEIDPDIIFVHGGQNASLRDIVKYKKAYPQKLLYIDQHGDYYNSPVDNLKSSVKQKIIYGHWMREAIPYTKKYWGVTPWRSQYLHEVYGIPEEKIGLLVMGGDDDYIHFSELPGLRTSIREKLNISSNDFVIITGGKIDRTKNIHLLMKAIQKLNDKHVKLIVFGQANTDIEEEIDKLSNHSSIRNIGWIESTKVYDYYLASDLAFFPGTHSVLWEQAAACGLPMVVKDWEGMHHLDVGGNCIFIASDSENEYIKVINDIIKKPEVYKEMKNIAVTKGIKTFSYKEIAKRAIS